MNEAQLSWWATGLFGVTAVGAVFVDGLRGAAAVVAVVLFAAGAVLMAVALVMAAGRSREVVIGVGELFFGAPRPMLASLAAQTVIGVATAAARPYTSAALGVLVPVAGLGLCGLWSARHRSFPARET